MEATAQGDRARVVINARGRWEQSAYQTDNRFIVEVKPMVDGKKVRALVNFTPKRHATFPDVPAAKELGWDVSNGVWYLLMVPKGTPAPVVRHLHDAAKAAIDDPKFRETMGARGIDVDYRVGEALRADLWREYKTLTPILRRTGMVKK